MINLEFDNAVVMRQKAALESMLVSNPDTAANIRKLITQEIAKARAAISQSAKGEMGCGVVFDNGGCLLHRLHIEK